MSSSPSRQASFLRIAALACVVCLAATSAACTRRQESPRRAGVPAAPIDAAASTNADVVPSPIASDVTAAPPLDAVVAENASPAAYAPPSPDDQPDPGVLAADLVPGWVPGDAPRTYVPDDLHMLVDGGDGVFLQYGFAWAQRRTYRPERAVASRVRVELYAFSTPAGALGRYDHESREGGGAPWSAEPPPEPLAGKVDAARLDADQLRLARGRFMAVLRYEDDAETDVTRLIAAAHDPLLAFAAALAARLSQGAADAGP
jgi:hypothetical protein